MAGARGPGGKAPPSGAADLPARCITRSYGVLERYLGRHRPEPRDPGGTRAARLSIGSVGFLACGYAASGTRAGSETRSTRWWKRGSHCSQLRRYQFRSPLSRHPPGRAGHGAAYDLVVLDWLPEGFEHPERVDLPTGHHMRPIREADVDIDYPAVMGSRERLWAKYGEVWGWPPATMSHAADREDLAHHEAEIAAHETFNYAILNEDETELLGCVYIDPPSAGSPADADAVVSWWVVDAHHSGELERALGEFIPVWLAGTWAFRAVHWFP